MSAIAVFALAGAAVAFTLGGMAFEANEDRITVFMIILGFIGNVIAFNALL